MGPKGPWKNILSEAEQEMEDMSSQGKYSKLIQVDIGNPVSAINQPKESLNTLIGPINGLYFKPLIIL